MIANFRQWESEVDISRTQCDSKLPPMGIGGRGFVLDCLIGIPQNQESAQLSSTDGRGNEVPMGTKIE